MTSPFLRILFGLAVVFVAGLKTPREQPQEKQVFLSEDHEQKRNRLLAALRQGLTDEDYDSCMQVSARLSLEHSRQPGTQACLDQAAEDVRHLFGIVRGHNFAVQSKTKLSELYTPGTQKSGPALAAISSAESQARAATVRVLTRIMNVSNPVMHGIIIDQVAKRDAILAGEVKLDVKRSHKLPLSALTPQQFLSIYRHDFG